jgi:hypothetical protein
MIVSTLQIGPSAIGTDAAAPSISVAPPPNAQSLTGVVRLHAEAMDDVGVLKIVWLIDGAPASRRSQGAVRLQLEHGDRRPRVSHDRGTRVRCGRQCCEQRHDRCQVLAR